jgi:hypothetical protein
MRRILISPQHKTSSSETNWIENLKWFGSLLMQIIGVVYNAAATINQQVVVPVGAVIAFDFGVEDLLMSSGVNQGPIDPNETQAAKWKNQCFLSYRQGRLVTLRVNIVPTGKLAERGGSVVASLVPLTIKEAEADSARGPVEAGKKYGDMLSSWQFPTLSTLYNQPRSVIQSAARTLSLTYSPCADDLAGEWQVLGYPGDVIQAYTLKGELAPCPWINQDGSYGGRPVLRLMLGFSDISAESAATALADYGPASAMFEVSFDARVELKEQFGSPTSKYTQASQGWETVENYCVIRHRPLLITNPNEVVEHNNHVTRHVGLDKYTVQQNGIMKRLVDSEEVPFEALNMETQQ